MHARHTRHTLAGTLVNPYINYPFVPPIVRFIENYTAQAR